jgi:hypothetical protein
VPGKNRSLVQHISPAVKNAVIFLIEQVGEFAPKAIFFQKRKVLLETKSLSRRSARPV